MEPKYPEEYTLCQMRQRLLMIAIKKDYGNIESKIWKDIFFNLLAIKNGITEREHEFLILVSRLIDSSNETSLCKISSLIEEKPLYQHGFAIVKEILSNLKEKPKYDEDDSESYRYLKRQVMDNLISDREINEINDLMEQFRFWSFRDIIQRLQYRETESVNIAFKVMLISLYSELREIEDNLLFKLKKQLCKGLIDAQGIYNNDIRLRTSPITKNQWELLSFILPDSASDGHSHRYSKIIFSIPKPKKENVKTKNTYINSWITIDLGRKRFPDLNKVNLDNLAGEYQQRLVENNKEPYNDKASIRRIISKRFKEHDRENYVKPLAGRQRRN